MGYDGSLLIKPTFYCYSCKNELTLIFGKILQQLNNSYCYVNVASSHDNISRFFPLFNCLVFLPFSWAHNAFSMEFCHKNVHCVPKLEITQNEHSHYGYYVNFQMCLKTFAPFAIWCWSEACIINELKRIPSKNPKHFFEAGLWGQNIKCIWEGQTLPPTGSLGSILCV